MAPRGEPSSSLPVGSLSLFRLGGMRLEDSPSGLWRTLGKRVECKLSGVRIPYPPPYLASPLATVGEALPAPAAHRGIVDRRSPRVAGRVARTARA